MITAKLFSFKGILLEVLFTIVNNNPETAHLLLRNKSRCTDTSGSLAYSEPMSRKNLKFAKVKNIALLQSIIKWPTYSCSRSSL